MNNKDNKKNENNEKKNSKSRWKKLMVGILLGFIFLAGLFFGGGDWSQGLNNLLWAFVMFLTIKVHGRADDLREKYIDALKHCAYLFLKSKTDEMKVKYFENRFGNFEDLIKKEEKDPNPPSFEESQGEPSTPASSAAANEENEMGHIAEDGGSHD